MKTETGTVYSTDFGRMCTKCNKPQQNCACSTVVTTRTGSKDGLVRVVSETAGRKGKVVTLIKGLPLGDTEMAALLAELKKRCGAGGTVKGDTIEIQGEHRALLCEHLSKKGYRCK